MLIYLILVWGLLNLGLLLFLYLRHRSCEPTCPICDGTVGLAEDECPQMPQGGLHSEDWLNRNGPCEWCGVPVPEIGPEE